MNRRFDYDTLEKQYIQGDMSLRALAETVDMKNHSLMMRQSKKREWPRKRREYREKSDSTALSVMADKQGHMAADEAKVRNNAIGAIDEMITRLRGDLTKTKTVLRDGVYVEVPMVSVTPNDVAMLIDRLQTLFNKPSQITEDRSVGVNFTTGDPALLRDLVAVTRGIGLDGGATTASPLPSAPEPSDD
jgi:hypothetical protein